MICRKAIACQIGGLIVLSGTVSLASEEPLEEQVRWGDIDEVKQLIVEGLDVNATYEAGATALHWAATDGKQLLDIPENRCFERPQSMWASTPRVPCRVNGFGTV